MTEHKAVSVVSTESFDLFQAMRRSLRCYDLSTILQKDSMIRTRQEATRRTIHVIVRTVVELTPE